MSRVSQKRLMAELQKIAEQHQGYVRPEDVVEFAKNPATLLYTKFTWDDGEAAHQWRLNQARQILRVMVIKGPTDPPRKIRTFISMKEDRYNGFGYRFTADIMADDDLRQVMLEELQEYIQVFLDKFEHFKEAADIVREMKKTSQTIGKPRSQRKYKRQTAQLTA